MSTYIVEVTRQVEQKASFAIDAKNKQELNEKCQELFNDNIQDLNEKFEEAETVNQIFAFTAYKLNKDEGVDFTEVVDHY
jgi:hypothetical protein